ncbi:MAG: hypothetical protein JSW07_09060, partial [bacterium]
MNNSVKQGKKPFIVHPSNFIPGLELNEGFYFDVVKGIVESNFPNLKYSAGLTGHCSDCLGFDTVISTDHAWGPRLQLFLRENDYTRIKAQLHNILAYNLPLNYKGFPTNQFKGCWGMEEVDKPPINHWIQLETASSFVNNDV